jgi:hypothetical protein
MKNLFVESTEKTPLIDFNQLTGELVLSGRSIPENAAKIYEPVLEWTLEYINNARTITNFRHNLEYFNTASSIWVSKILKTLGGIKNPESILLIHIYFDIEDFDSIEDIKNDIIHLSNFNIGNNSLSVSYKIYGVDADGKILKESIVFV